MTYRCAFLGCGPRANGHAQAYQYIDRGTMVACCDLNESRLNAYSDRYKIAGRYTKLDEMLEKEKPDVVHLVTPPTLRVELMTQLSAAGVPGVIVEKPICIGASDYKALRDLEQKTQTRFVVNHQLRHHLKILEFLRDVAEGKIGQVRFIDASAVLPMAGQGVHVLDLIFAFSCALCSSKHQLIEAMMSPTHTNSGYAPKAFGVGEPCEQVETVFGASSGYDDINGTHPSPRTAETLITFKNGIRAALQAGEGAPMLNRSAPNWGHKRIAVYGTHGFRHWWMQGCEKSLPDGTIEKLAHDYATEDVYGQAGLTNALFDWLEDYSNISPTNLRTALDEWLVILAGYLSTVEARPVDLPFDPPDDLLGRFKTFVGAAMSH